MQQHCDPDVLALRALGEPAGTSADDEHLATCEVCSTELAELREVVGVATAEGMPMKLETPADTVWEGVSRELELDRTQPEPATSPRGMPSWMLALAAGVTGLAVGGVVVASVQDDPAPEEQPPEEIVVASTELEPLPDWGDSLGRAEVVVTDAGEDLLVEVVVAEADADGFREVWLIDENVEGMISLGVLDGDTGEFPIPAGLDLAEFPIVDVSLEPFDGEPRHSGNSIVRGVLET